MRVLIVDDDPTFRRLLEKNLSSAGFDTVTSTSGREALAVQAEGGIDLVVSDIQMPEMDGIGLLRELRRRDAQLPVVLVTAHATVETAIKALKLGAFDYIRKPTDLEKLSTTVKNALAHRRLTRRVAQLEDALEEKYSRAAIVGQSRAMERVYAALGRVSESGVPVLLTGESGTGKELIAKAIHFGGPRREGPFVAVNCAAIPEGLMESELFGHEKGAFTGAAARRQGKFELASGGTLLLDEIGDLALGLQAKLLRTLQEKEIERVGGSGTLAVDVRIVAATHQDLAHQVKTGAFREDLYYRLNVFPIHLPPLRERPEDIAPLARHFLDLFNRDEGRALVGFAPEALDLLCSLPWPGNVRELQNRILRAGVLCAGKEIGVADLEASGTAHATGTGSASPPPETSPPAVSPMASGWDRSSFPTLEEVERDAIERALAASEGNVSKAARMLGIGKATLYRKIKLFAPRTQARAG